MNRRADQAPDLLVEHVHDGDQRSEVDGDVEGNGRCFPSEHERDELKMAARRNGDELRQSLDETEDERVQQAHDGSQCPTRAPSSAVAQGQARSAGRSGMTASSRSRKCALLSLKTLMTSGTETGGMPSTPTS